MNEINAQWVRANLPKKSEYLKGTFDMTTAKNSTKSTTTNAEYLALCIERGRIRREAKNDEKSEQNLLTKEQFLARNKARNKAKRREARLAKKSAKLALRGNKWARPITKLPMHCKDAHGSHKLGLSDAKFAEENYPKGNVASDIAYMQATIGEDEIPALEPEILEPELTADERRELNIAIGGEVFSNGKLIS